jgi:hypothetical protein
MNIDRRIFENTIQKISKQKHRSWKRKMGREQSARIEVKKVKEYRNRPGEAQSVPGGLGSQIYMTFGT